MSDEVIPTLEMWRKFCDFPSHVLWEVQYLLQYFCELLTIYVPLLTTESWVLGTSFFSPALEEGTFILPCKHLSSRFFLTLGLHLLWPKLGRCSFTLPNHFCSHSTDTVMGARLTAVKEEALSRTRSLHSDSRLVWLCSWWHEWMQGQPVDIFIPNFLWLPYHINTVWPAFLMGVILLPACSTLNFLSHSRPLIESLSFLFLIFKNFSRRV